jgi:hypothetical protein
MDKSQTHASYTTPSVRGYHRVEGNQRASRNGRVSDRPPEIPNLTIRNFLIAVYWAPHHLALYKFRNIAQASGSNSGFN